jgi:excisionase family DNA binding protein
MEQMMTRKEFAKYLNISIDVIDMLRSEGMPWIQVRTRVRIPVDQAVAWMRDRAVNGYKKEVID